ncbi:hypothetical protein FWP57_00875 [Vibrio cholerae]|nr:hypothetical protein [Vibrio cholerae]
MIDFQAAGFADVNDMLVELQAVLGKKAVRKAAKAAMQPVLNEVKSTSPFNDWPDNVHLLDAFKISVSGRTKNNTKKGDDVFLSARVQTQGKAVEQYAALVEFGRADYTTSRTNAFGIKTRLYNVQMPQINPNPFMRTALNKHKEQVVNTFGTALVQEIQDIQSKRSRIAKNKINAKARKAKRMAGQ